MRRIISRFEGMSRAEASWLIVIMTLVLWSVIALFALGVPMLVRGAA